MLGQWIHHRAARGTVQALYGVNAFHVMWEDMCKVAFGPSGIDHAESASQPHVIQGRTKLGLRPQRPDLLAEVDGGILIADAKWYRFWAGDYPGTPDVMKQLMYEMSTAPGVEVVGNSFLVPVPDAGADGFSAVGHIQMESAGHLDPRFPLVTVVGMQWDKVVEGYLSGVHFPGLKPFLAKLIQVPEPSTPLA